MGSENWCQLQVRCFQHNPVSICTRPHCYRRCETSRSTINTPVLLPKLLLFHGIVFFFSPAKSSSSLNLHVVSLEMSSQHSLPKQPQAFFPTSPILLWKSTSPWKIPVYACFQCLWPLPECESSAECCTAFSQATGGWKLNEMENCTGEAHSLRSDTEGK